MPKVSKVGKFRAKASLSSDPSLSKKTKDDGGVKHEGSGSVKAAAVKEANVTESLSRGQRKRQAKREQYLRREKMIISSLRLKRIEDQKNRIDGLDALREALPTGDSIRRALERKKAASSGATDSATTSGPSESDVAVPCGTNKAKKDLACLELNHMNLVLQHPAFKSDPFSTIQEHLRNTLATQAKEQVAVNEKRRKEEEESKAKTKQLRKERLRSSKVHKKKRSTAMRGAIGSAGQTNRTRRR